MTYSLDVVAPLDKPQLTPQIGAQAPGPGLLAAIDAARSDGRPTLLPRGLPVAAPHPQQLPFLVAIDADKPLPLRWPSPHHVVPAGVVHALTDARSFNEQMAPRSHGRAALRRLYAAAMRDLAAAPIDDVAAFLGQTDHKAHAAIARGRATWAQLGAWPWVCFDRGRPCRDWWTHELVIDTWDGWQDPVAWRARGLARDLARRAQLASAARAAA